MIKTLRLPNHTKLRENANSSLKTKALSLPLLFLYKESYDFLKKATKKINEKDVLVIH